MIQSIEAIKLLAGIGDSLIGRLLHFDALGMKFREFKLKRDPECPICGDTPSIDALIDYDAFCGIPKASEMDDSDDEITVEDYEAIVKSGREHLLLDVRESFELEIAALPGAKHVSMGELSSRLPDLPKDAKIYVLCKSGGRSRQATDFLHDQGFQSVVNIAGGINAWSERIDSNIPLY